MFYRMLGRNLLHEHLIRLFLSSAMKKIHLPLKGKARECRFLHLHIYNFLYL